MSTLLTNRLSGLDKFAIVSPYLFRILEEVFFYNTIFFGKGLAFFGFGFFLIYTLVRNSNYLIKSFSDQVTVFLLLFVAFCALMESYHVDSNYVGVFRTSFMLGAAPLYASWMLRDKNAIHYILLGFLLYAGTIALNIALNFSLTTMLSFENADQARIEGLDRLFFGVDLNGAGNLSELGMIICYLYGVQYRQRFRFAIAFDILMGIFLYALVCCVSRSAYLNTFFVIAIFLFRYGIQLKTKHLIVILLFPILITTTYYQKIDNLLFSRFRTIEIGNEESSDSRVRLYSVLLSYVDEVFWTGVGEGNYNGEWGYNSDLAVERYNPETGSFVTTLKATHNSFAQLLFYWGIGAVLLYVVINIKLITMLPGASYTDLFSRIVTALMISTLVSIMFTNVYNGKEFTLAYGMVMGLYLRRKYKNE